MKDFTEYYSRMQACRFFMTHDGGVCFGSQVGYRLSDVAVYFARDMATVGTLIARVSGRIQSDEKLRWEINRLAKIVES